jgi:hypothetical protein
MGLLPVNSARVSVVPRYLRGSSTEPPPGVAGKVLPTDRGELARAHGEDSPMDDRMEVRRP